MDRKAGKKKLCGRVVQLKQRLNDRMHPDNPFRDLRLDQLGLRHKELKEKYASLSRIVYFKSGLPSIDWSDQDALLVFTRAVFADSLGVDWALPRGYLIPRLPARMNFLLAVRDVYKRIHQRDIESCHEM